MTAHCPTCDRPLATSPDDDFTARCSAPFSGGHCRGDVVDWRARALAAEARLTQSDPIHPMPDPMTPERIADIERGHRRVAKDIAVEHPVGIQERSDHRAIGELLAEVRRLQHQVTHWRDARRIAIEAGDMMRDRVAALEGQLKLVMLAPVPGAAPNVARAWEAYDRIRGETRQLGSRIAALEAGLREACDGWHDLFRIEYPGMEPAPLPRLRALAEARWCHDDSG